MLHYHVWFNLRPWVAEAHGLEVVSTFLAELSRAGEANGFRLMRNLGRPPRSKLPAYHALVEFADAGALETAMRAQRQRGIHAGRHGRVIDAVCDFHVEIFTSLVEPETSAALQACEI